MPFIPSAALLPPYPPPANHSHSYPGIPLTSGPTTSAPEAEMASSLPSSPLSLATRSHRVQKEQDAKIRYEQMKQLNKERMALRKRMREEGLRGSQLLDTGAGNEVRSSGGAGSSLGSSTGSDQSSVPSSDTLPSSIESSRRTTASILPYGHPCSSQHLAGGLPVDKSSSYPFKQYIPSTGLTRRSGVPELASPREVVMQQQTSVSLMIERSHPIAPTPNTSPPLVPAPRIEDDDDADLRRLMEEAEARRRQPVQESYAPVVEAAHQASRDIQRVEECLRAETDIDTRTGAVPENQVHRRFDRDPERAVVQSFRVLSDSENERRQRAITFLEGLFLELLGDIVRSTKILSEREMSGSAASNKTGVKRGKRKLEVELEEGHENTEEEGSDRVKEGRGGTGYGNNRQAEIGIKMRLRNRTTGEDQVVSYPDDPASMKKDTALHKLSCRFRIAELLYEAILKRCVTTKRDIYYKDVQLFKTQPVVDKIVDDMVATAGLKRQDFMVCAASKGLVASSSLRIHLKSGEELSLSSSNASLIPPIERIGKVEAEGGVAMVLIVEKDAVFQTLLSLQLLDQPGLGQAVLITGKGYPDLATLQLCKLISIIYPTARFHALVDADPHGIDIMQVYANGSKSTTHSHDHAGLALGPRLDWMGVKASEWLGLGVKHDDLLMLSDKDVEKAMAMLRRRDLPLACKRELQHMLHLNRKAEIQILSSIGGNQETLESVYAGGPGLAGDGGKTRMGLLGYVTERLMGP